MLFCSIPDFRVPIGQNRNKANKKPIAAMKLFGGVCCVEDTSKRINGDFPSQAE
jgi:hypothetical protein